MRGRYAFDILHEVYVGARHVLAEKQDTVNVHSTTKYLWRPDLRPRLVEFVADFVLAGESALAAPRWKERRVLFRMFYCQSVAYHAARARMGLSELAWEQWTDEIRDLAGREMLRRGLFPPRRYFAEGTQPSSPQRH